MSFLNKLISEIKNRMPMILIEGIIFLLLLALFFYLAGARDKKEVTLAGADPSYVDLIPDEWNYTPPATTQPGDETSSPAVTPAPTPVPTPTPTPEPSFAPQAVESTLPENLIKTVGISDNGITLTGEQRYEADESEHIFFGYGDDYTDVNGIITFRGNNFRDGGAYGYADMENFKLSQEWNYTTGTLTHNGAVWTGSGWTGQPLIVKWPKETKAIMNMYDWAKEDDELVEVIYATMDGYIYFLDLETGKQTRDKLFMGYTFKGSGALDPRGYPIMYIGAGYDSDRGYSRAFVISLIDFSIMYEFGHKDIEANGGFSLRGNLSYFDASALVDVENDQLIYPGENGIVYIIKLNTEYDESAGTVDINPDNVRKWRYYGTRTSLASHWVGMEGSPVIWDGHMIMCDNGGNLMCLDLNTLELTWVQDILDDSNGTPVLSIEDGHPYIYVSTSFHYGWRSYTTADVPIWKIDAETGEIVWQVDYKCYTESGVSGGVQSTVALGKNDLEGRIYVTVAKTDNNNNGVLACIDTDTGEVLWEHKAYYTWSSPVLVYNSDGSGYIVYCTYGNNMYLLDGENGEVLDSFNLLGGVEATPAVYEDMVVVGTRKCLIWGIRLT